MVLGRAGTQVLAGFTPRHKLAGTQCPAGPSGCFHCGCHADEHAEAEVGHHLETVSGSGTKFSEAKQKRNGPEKHTPPHSGA